MTGPANDAAPEKAPVQIDTRRLVYLALANDVARMQAQQPPMVQIVDAGQHLAGHRRRQEGKNGAPDTPDLVTLAVPPDVLLSLRDGGPDAKFVVLLTLVPMQLARELATRSESRIVRPGDPIGRPQ